MTAPYNPRAAADQARATYRAATTQLGQLGLDTTIPEDMRAVAVKTVAQSREAYDRSKDAFEASLTTFERSFDRCRPKGSRVQPQDDRHRPAQCRCELRLGYESGGRQDLCGHVGAAGGFLAQAARCIDGASRRSSRAVNEGYGRCAQADQSSNGATAWMSASRTVDVIR